MNRQAAIVDTNVVVAGLLTAHPESPVARILDGMLDASFPFVVSEALLAEYRTVLIRPALRKLHGLTVAQVDAIVTDLALNAIVLTPVEAAPAPDPADQLLWGLLAVRTDLLLITGDKHSLRDAGMRGRVVSPRTFVALIAADRLKRERIHLLLIDDARRGLADISAGRTQDADVAVAKLQARRASTGPAGSKR